ncbi:hypothetical protein [Paenibacillus sp. Marseille-Q4541]|uniref:hypothetical protein n=1 Tax=Paenibacillus sp. Marseille-Q4541 TaxID=2831522 RepID=UPI001BA56035|nr:hypothetical protein [Paenibacillus sp. Marseille-Q4541]
MPVGNGKPSCLLSRTLIAWYMHLCIFALAQLLFFVFDDYDTWHAFKLNPMGEWILFNLNSFLDFVLIHKSNQLNGVTLLWGILVLIHGAHSISYVLISKRRESYKG